MSERTQSLVLAAIWWASMVIVGWILGVRARPTEFSDGTVNPMPTIVLSLLFGLIILVILVVAVGVGLSRRVGAAAALALGAPCLWLGAELAARL